MNTLTRSIFACLLLAFMTAFLSSPAEAQKKKKEQPAQQQAVQPQSESPSAPPPTAPKGASFKDFLGQYVGTPTNLGKLTKVANDYVVFDDEGITVVFPLSSIQGVKIIKAEEGEPQKLDIKLL